jgi:hypothetical protein
LKRLAEEGSIKIAACFPRAIKWLFHTAKAPLPIASTEVLNMRNQSAEEIISRLFEPEINPNVPAGKITLPAPSELPASATAGQDQPAAVVAP